MYPKTANRVHILEICTRFGEVVTLLSFWGVALLSPGVVDDFHCVGFGLFGDVDVGAHCLVVGVAGPFHHDLRRDAAGQGEADECPAPGVGADERPFGVGLLYFLSGAEEHLRDWGVEAAELAKVFEIVVHLLVGDDGEGEAHRVFVVLVLLEYRLGVLAEVDREAVVGLLGGDVDFVVGDVGALEGGHIGVAEAGEGAEAEEVAGLGEGAGFLDGFLVFEAVHIGELDFGAVGGDVVAIELQELFFGEGDDGLFEDLEFRAVFVDGFFGAVAFADGPVEEPFEVVELLLDGFLLEVLLDAEEADELVDTIFVEVIVADAFAEGFEVVAEGFPALEGGVGPLVGYAFFSDELV